MAWLRQSFANSSGAKVYALIDANSFYASCEQVFRPDLRNKPVVVLSSNDGCIIARNAEAKALGIRMGDPYFKCRDFLQQQAVKVFSSNYALYADMSQRMMRTIATLAPAIEVYSIDECFAAVDGISDLEQLGHSWRATIRQWTGLTCGIGFGPTKTLAKLANHAAKKYPATGGVVDLSDPARQRRLMQLVPVGDVWGVGHRIVGKLNDRRIYTALDLANCDPAWIRRSFNVVLARTVDELNGKSCLRLEEVTPPKQQIVCSRSFACKITSLQDLSEAVAEYTARAAEKLRHEQQLCQLITVFAHSSRFVQPAYSAQRIHMLPAPTADTRDLVKAAMGEIAAIFREGVGFAKAGVILSDFSGQARQESLFATPGIKNDLRLMRVIDNLNQKQRHSIYLAAQGINQPWAMKRRMLSPAYTTRWDSLPLCR